jgi:hypothetical protein
MAQPQVQLAKRINYRDTQNLYRLAPQGLPAFLALEMPIWPAADSIRAPTADPQDGAREPYMGRGANCTRVAAETGLARGAAYDSEILA